MLYDGKLLMLASPPGAKHHVGGPAQDDIGQAGHQHHQGHSTISIISIVSIISIISIIRPSVPSFFLLLVAFMFFYSQGQEPPHDPQGKRQADPLPQNRPSRGPLWHDIAPPDMSQHNVVCRHTMLYSATHYKLLWHTMLLDGTV